MGAIQGFFRLPFYKRRLIIEAAVMISFTNFGLHLTSFQKLQSFFQQLFRLNKVRYQKTHPNKSDIAWAIETTGQKLFKDDTCLVIALAGQSLLKLYGIPAKLQLGCLKGDKKTIFAHAWVESDGEVIIGGTERDISKYTPLTDLKGVRV